MARHLGEQGKHEVFSVSDPANRLIAQTVPQFITYKYQFSSRNNRLSSIKRGVQMTYMNSYKNQNWLMPHSIKDMIPKEHICFFVEEFAEDLEVEGSHRLLKVFFLFKMPLRKELWDGFPC